MSSAAVPPSARASEHLPTGPQVSDILDEFCRDAGIAVLSLLEIANLPPWTEREAAAFERTISEAFEHVKAIPKLL